MQTQMPNGDILAGAMAVTAAVSVALVKVIDHFSKRNGGGKSHCEAYAAMDRMLDRMQEYHEENRDVLRDIRDGITELVRQRR